MIKMEFLLLRSLVSLSILIFWLIATVAAAMLSNETDRAALLAFKAGLSIDSRKRLSSWNDSAHFCEWEGITCSRWQQRVVWLHLQDRELLGPFSPQLTNLTFLQQIKFQDNHFYGELPPELGRLLQLQVLNLSGNAIEGQVPSNLSYCSDLQVLNFDFNRLTGEPPKELSSLKRLEVLCFGSNKLEGAILPSVGNLSSLRWLSFRDNSFSGPIPSDLGRLQNLSALLLSSNILSGKIPQSIYNISSLKGLVLGANQLHGSLPPDLGLLLPGLTFLYLGANQFSGPIPLSLSNASNLRYILLFSNGFSGKVPAGLGMLQDLRILQLSFNQLGEGDHDLSIITHLTNCTRLEGLGLYQNPVSGRVPQSTSNLSTHLWYLTLRSSKVYGEIPSGIEKLVGLEILRIMGGSLTGNIPDGIGMLPRLQKLVLFGNILSGQIPSLLCNNSRLLELNLGSNSLQGTIPLTILHCQRLGKINLRQNKLNGSIPREIFAITSLSILLDLSHNSLTGSLPLEVGDLKDLGQFYANNNKLSGEIPVSLGSCDSLEFLYLGNNLLQGTIPSGLSNIRNMRELDLSHNNLTGHIPGYLGKFQFLRFLNLSFNNFDGEVPKEGIFTNITGFLVRGNNKVCGGHPVLRLPTCPTEDNEERGRQGFLKLIIPLTVSFVLASVAIFLVLTCWKRRSRKEAPSSVTCFNENHPMMSYTDLSKATNGFSVENLIGSGRFASVYKGELEQGGVIVAVKVLNLQVLGASSTFAAECNALRNIRHRNLVKTITACSSVDYASNDFKALIFEYMPNGSLDMWLHQLKSLNLLTRLNIAFDVASALDYLHTQCQIPIVHCDLKPNNILLDDELGAHVADFGLAKFLCEATGNSEGKQSSTIAIKGTIGYIPPEYGAGGNVSILGDVYSYGILLLELFTGKRPTDNIFSNGLTLHHYVQMALPMQVLEILDLPLLTEIETLGHERVIKCASYVLNVGISCSAQSPKERMKIGRVLGELSAARTVIGHNVML